MSGELIEDADGDVITMQDNIEFMPKGNNTKLEQIIVKGTLIDDIVSFKFRNDYTSIDVDFTGIN